MPEHISDILERCTGVHHLSGGSVAKRMRSEVIDTRKRENVAN
jgi:hypothetical protein